MILCLKWAELSCLCIKKEEGSYLGEQNNEIRRTSDSIRHGGVYVWFMAAEPLCWCFYSMFYFFFIRTEGGSMKKKQWSVMEVGEDEDQRVCIVNFKQRIGKQIICQLIAQMAGNFFDARENAKEIVEKMNK